MPRSSTSNPGKPFRVLRDAAFAQWRPRNAWEAQYVEEIADCSWRIARLRLCASHDSNVSIKRLRQAAEHPLQWMDAVTQTEVAASTANGAQTLLQRRVNALIGNRLKVTAELRALQNVISLGTSQDLLITQDLPAGTSQEIPHGDPLETQNNPALTQK
jgi:hypothetical protein